MIRCPSDFAEYPHTICIGCLLPRICGFTSVRKGWHNGGRPTVLSSAGTLACAVFAIAVKLVTYLLSTKPHSQEWLCYKHPT